MMSGLKTMLAPAKCHLYTLALVSTLALSGCSSGSSPDSSHYYLLNKPTAAKSHKIGKTVTDAKTPVMVSVQMPEYLDSPYLVMQIDDHRMHYATFHMWAEPLADATETALLQDLNQSAQFQFIADKGDSAELTNEDAGLIIQLDYFHVAQSSEVILAGNYTYRGSARPFFIETQMESDGFSHSVAKMRQLITELANAILADIS